MKELRDYQKIAIKECWNALIKDDDPVLLMASVGSGKSLMIADILLRMQKAGKRALCLVNNAELVRNNCATFINEGGNASIYCAALGSKDARSPIVFGTPQSVLNGITKNETIAHIKFNIIVVDEAHAINCNNHHTGFMRILRHYKQEYPDMRLLGATGTNFRFKETPIVGDDALFKTQVGNITTEWLIENNYLIEPNFEIDKNLVLDFSQVRIKSNGQFDQKQLEGVVQRSALLTELICDQIVHVMETKRRRGCFIFATTKKHAEEIYSHLPMGETAIILGETPQHERTQILNGARDGSIRYLVNIAIISVGVDIPAYDTIAYLRPTESLVLLVQTMGRVLRLSPSTRKTESLVLDFAGNIERHADWDNPILINAIKKLNDNKSHDILCPICLTMNTENTRRCIGKEYNKRCDYYFEFKDCPNLNCGVQNDITVRNCRKCGFEFINPDDKLNLIDIKKHLKEYKVISTSYGVSDTRNGFRINCWYKCLDDKGRNISFYEGYSPINKMAQRVFYGQFIKKHCEDSSKWYALINIRSQMQQMLKFAKSPNILFIKFNGDKYKIQKKIFDNNEELFAGNR